MSAEIIPFRPKPHARPSDQAIEDLYQLVAGDPMWGLLVESFGFEPFLSHYFGDDAFGVPYERFQIADALATRSFRERKAREPYVGTICRMR